MISVPRTNPPDEDRGRPHKPPTDLSEVRRSIDTLFDEGAVIELRAFGPFGDVVSGYYDDYDALTRKAVELDRGGYQVYAPLNEIDPAFSQRVLNKTSGKAESTTADRDIIRRRWLLLDIDPVRPANTSATHEEKKAAHLKTKEIREHLWEQGWPDPIAADSGNGFWLLYRIDLPNDPESKELVKRVLEALAAEFDDDGAKIDVSVHNAARLIRLLGTANHKGKDSVDRPHRRSKIKRIPEER